MDKELLKTVLSKREKSVPFPDIRKNLIDVRRFPKDEVNKVIGLVHDYEAQIALKEKEIAKYRTLSRIGLTILIPSTIFTLVTLFFPVTTYYAILYGPIIFGVSLWSYGFGSIKKGTETLELIKKKFFLVQ